MYSLVTQYIVCLFYISVLINKIVTGQMEKIGLGSHYSKYLHTAFPQTRQKNHFTVLI